MDSGELLAWRHVILNTRCSWLHGDARGFRDRGHRIHSSGDYRNPPPAGEHAGLHRWMAGRAGEKVVFPRAAWAIVGEALRDRLVAEDRRVLAVAVGAVHAHLLVELPIALADCKREVGFAKRHATERVKAMLVGQLWAQGGTFKRIADFGHQRQTFYYIVCKQRPSWVWDFRAGGRFVE